MRQPSYNFGYRDILHLICWGLIVGTDLRWQFCWGIISGQDSKRDAGDNPMGWQTVAWLSWLCAKGCICPRKLRCSGGPGVGSRRLGLRSLTLTRMKLVSQSTIQTTPQPLWLCVGFDACLQRDAGQTRKSNAGLFLIGRSEWAHSQTPVHFTIIIQATSIINLSWGWVKSHFQMWCLEMSSTGDGIFYAHMMRVILANLCLKIVQCYAWPCAMNVRWNSLSTNSCSCDIWQFWAG